MTTPGKLDVLVVDQAETWTDIKGDVHNVADIDQRYAANIVAFLEKRAERLHWRYASLLGLFMAPEGSAAELSLIEAAYELSERDPLTWLRAKPLHKALSAKANAHE